MEIKERPIPLHQHEVKGILNEGQTQIRRVVKFSTDESVNRFEHKWWKAVHPCASESSWVFWYEDRKDLAATTKSNFDGDGIKCPYGKPGDQLWVLETWQSELSGRFVYKASANIELKDNLKWKPSIHMPRNASRILLEITDVRVERVQDITRSDIRAEGLICPQEFASDDVEYNYKQWYPDEWIKLWNSINERRGYGWSVNPWVWVIEFKDISDAVHPH